ARELRAPGTAGRIALHGGTGRLVCIGRASGDFMKNKDEMLESVTSVRTSVAPTASARTRLRPIDGHDVVIRDGLLADRQRVNREVTLYRGAEELERAGTLDTFRIAAGRMSGDRR